MFDHLLIEKVIIIGDFFGKIKKIGKFLFFKIFYLNKSQADKILPSFCKRVIKTSPPFKAALILAARLSGGLV
mgnify:FL=1